MTVGNNTYLLCIPGGGFNDCLCQIEKCWKYAEVNSRILVVYCIHKNCGIYDRFDTYFTTNLHHVILHPTEKLLSYLKTLPAYPNILQGNIIPENIKYSPELHAYVCPNTGIQLSFDFNKRYKEALLVHHTCGGCNNSVDCLQRLCLKRDIAEHIAKALLPLGDDYCAVHIRNTDYQTDYMPFFKKIFPQVRGKKLLICSDDRHCREVAKAFFVESEVLTVTDIPDTRQPLHRIHDNKKRHNLTMLTDLFALAGARELFFTNVSGHNYASGFSRLAENLRRRPDIVRNLFAEAKSLV